ncbi:DNA-processing protein DprA [Elusimicrobiota bacterium]
MNLSQQQRAVLTLHLVEDLGPRRFKSLIDRFGSAEKALNSSEYELKSVEQLPPKVAKNISQAKNRIDIDKEINLAEKIGARILTCFDESYPESLKNLYDCPLVLYVLGQKDINEIENIGIVGTRRPTNYGLTITSRFSKDFADIGLVTVSGLARGIDTQVHKSTVSAGGKTIAVLGNGLNKHYPPENRKLEEQISKNGALITEFPMDYPPDKMNFPRRNRIISGISKAVLVIEADIKSGALITAKYALDQGKDVFAVPGSIISEYSKGTNSLIKSGASLVQSSEDVICEIESFKKIQNKKGEAKKLSSKNENITDGSEKQILDILADNTNGIPIDYFVERLKIPSKNIALSLLNLELKGFVKALPGKAYIKT